MQIDPKLRRTLIRRVDTTVQIVAFFIAVLFIGGVVMSLSGKAVQGQGRPKPTTPDMIFYSPPPKVLTPKDFGISLPPPVNSDPGASDMGAFGEPNSEGQDERAGGWSKSAKANEKVGKPQ